MDNPTENQPTTAPQKDSKMKLVIAIIIVILLLLGLYVYSQKAQAPTSDEMGTQNADRQVPPSEPRSLRALLGLGASQKCTFTSVVANSASDGTVYMSGGKMRGDFTSRTTVNGKEMTVASHMISDANEMRMWQDGQTMGYMMQTPKQDGTPTSDRAPDAPPGQQSPLNFDDTATNYDCSGWTADQSLFTPPASVKFYSMSEMMNMNGSAGPMGAGSAGSDAGMMEGMEAGGGDMKAMQCASCDRAPDAQSKAQCRAALQCS